MSAGWRTWIDRNRARLERRLGRGYVSKEFDDIRVGDVVQWGAHQRKVRSVKHLSDGRLWAVTFAILRPSWTRRPYTVYMRSDARQCFRGIVARNVSLCSNDELECRTQKAIDMPSTMENDFGRRGTIKAREMAGKVQ